MVCLKCFPIPYRVAHSHNVPSVNKACRLCDPDKFRKVVSAISQESNPGTHGSESGPSHCSDWPRVTPLCTLHGMWAMGLRECQLEGR